VYQRSKKTFASLALVAAAAIALAGCSNGQAGTGTATGTKPVADLAAATAYLKPYTTAPTGLIINEPLKSLPAAGSTIDFLDAGTPIQAEFLGDLQAAAKILNVKIVRIQTGADAQSINTALNSVVESKPDAVINLAIDPTLFTSQLKQLKAANIPVIHASIVNADKFGITTILNGNDELEATGKALASAAIVRTKGKASKFVFYTVPELSFSALILKGAQDQLKAECASCSLRVVQIPVATLGSTAADAVVSDLQSHPDTQYFISALDEVQIGLAGKLKLAGLDIKGLGSSPAPANYQAIASGDEDAALGLDLNLFSWTIMDQTVRELAGQAVTYPDGATVAATLQHLITKQSNVADAQVGYTAIPDYVAQFTKLWTGK
jgi:ABC-type sugar transport system substrate-binding protein